MTTCKHGDVCLTLTDSHSVTVLVDLLSVLVCSILCRFINVLTQDSCIGSLDKKKITPELTLEITPRAQPRLKSWGGPRFGSQHRGACDPRPAFGKGRAGCWAREGFARSRCEGLGVSRPEIFLKTQMLNPAFWW